MRIAKSSKWWDKKVKGEPITCFGVYFLGSGNNVSVKWLLKKYWRILILMKCFAQILLMLQS